MSLRSTPTSNRMSGRNNDVDNDLIYAVSLNIYQGFFLVFAGIQGISDSHWCTFPEEN